MAAAAASYTTIPGHQVQRAARRHVAQPHALKRRHAHRGAEGAPMHRLAKTSVLPRGPSTSPSGCPRPPELARTCSEHVPCSGALRHTVFQNPAVCAQRVKKRCASESPPCARRVAVFVFLCGRPSRASRPRSSSCCSRTGAATSSAARVPRRPASPPSVPSPDLIPPSFLVLVLARA